LDLLGTTTIGDPLSLNDTSSSPKSHQDDLSRVEGQDAFFQLPDEALFDRAALVEALQTRGFDTTPFGMPFVPRPTTSSLVSNAGMGGAGDSTDAGSVSIDTASLDSGSMDEYSRRQSRRNTVLGEGFSGLFTRLTNSS